MRIFILSIILLFSLFLEVGIIRLPFILIAIALIGIITKSEWVFVLGIGLGIILDSLSFRLLGESSVFFVVFLGLIFLYQRRFEIQTIQFAIFSCLLGSFFYLLIFGSQNILLQSIVSGIIGGVVFWMLKNRVIKKELINF